MFNESWETNGNAFSDKAHLISGLFTAFTGLTEEALEDQLKEIVLMSQRIMFKFFPTHYVVLVAKKNVESKYLENLLNKICDEFNIRYDITEFRGKVDGFRTFIPIVNRIVEESMIKRENLKDHLKSLLKDEMLKLELKNYRMGSIG